MYFRKKPKDIYNYNKFLETIDKSVKSEPAPLSNLQFDLLINEVLKQYDQTYENYYKQSNYNDVNLYTNINPEKCANANTNTSQNALDIDLTKELVVIERDINSLGDLIQLINDFPYDSNKRYNINLCGLHKIKEPLIELNSMIGMKSLKENIVDQILFYIQNLHKSEYMHTVLYGPPGTGKTEVAKIIGKIFSKLGILNKGVFKKVTRSDLIAGYLGQTAIKTKDVIKESLGGVLFIDEAYALGNQEKRDSFSKECIDTLCEALSDNKDNLMVIIAGYETDLNECFFSYNQGLNSRFNWRFKIDEYSSEDLYNIFIKKVHEVDWTYDASTITVKWFERNKDYFSYFGRDIEVLFSKIKIAHARRVFSKNQEEKKHLTMVDMENGLKMFLNNDEVKKRKDKKETNKLLETLYI